MPYIKDLDKEKYDEDIYSLAVYNPTKGDLNYIICQLIGRVIAKTGVNYSNISEKIDAVHDAEMELRRRLLNPYEDKKIEENGDVSSFKTVLEIMKG